MNLIQLLGLCAGTETDPFGEPLLRALAGPDCDGLRWDVYPARDGLPPHGDRPGDALPTDVRALRARAAAADALVLAVPEPAAGPPDALLNALNWLVWPRAGSPLADKPVAVLTTTADDASDPAAFTEVEQLLLCSACQSVGPRTIVRHAGRLLREEPGGRVFIADPAVAMRLLLHIRQTETAARAASSPRRSGEDSMPWL
ncbi:NAD(P)H-dependent oxidoreductase [Streptomyces sp. NPDC005962]|uniref:NAD(P)H-dependent oxidoreductase n=1 Tax=Streptomyces sp. NPDC005962 TaxID=3154466 RepID=UPI0033E82392